MSCYSQSEIVRCMIAILTPLQAVNDKIDGCRRYLLRGSPRLCVQG